MSTAPSTKKDLTVCWAALKAEKAAHKETLAAYALLHERAKNYADRLRASPDGWLCTTIMADAPDTTAPKLDVPQVAPPPAPIPLTVGMSQEKAMELAVKRFGPKACVGNNRQFPGSPCYVGHKNRYGRWEMRGVGVTFEEAFKAVTEWPDGPPPRYET